MILNTWDIAEAKSIFCSYVEAIARANTRKWRNEDE